MEHFLQYNDGKAYPGDTGQRSQYARRRSPVHGIEQQALVEDGVNPYPRDKGKRRETLDRKANSSPYGISHQRRATRDNTSRTPQNHKPNKPPVAAASFYGKGGVHPAAPRGYDNHRAVSGPSRLPAKGAYYEIDDGTIAQSSSSGRGRDHDPGAAFFNNYAGPSQRTRHERAFRQAAPIYNFSAGSSTASDRNRRNSEPIQVLSDDEDDNAEVENRPPPRGDYSGSKSSPLNAARARYLVEEPPLRPRAPVHGKSTSHSGDEHRDEHRDEGIEDIEAFSQETPPDYKGKGRAEPQMTRPPQHTTIRGRMQKKDGTTLPPPPTRSSPVKSKTTAIPSSNIEPAVLTGVEFCAGTIGKTPIPLDITNISIDHEYLTLCRSVRPGEPPSNARIRYRLSDVKWVETYSDEVPMFRFHLHTNEPTLAKLNQARIMDDDGLVDGKILDVALCSTQQAADVRKRVHKVFKRELCWIIGDMTGREYFRDRLDKPWLGRRRPSVDHGRVLRAAEDRAKAAPSRTIPKAKQASNLQSTIQFPPKVAAKPAVKSAAQNGPKNSVTAVRRSGRISTTRTSTPNTNGCDDTSDIDEIPPPKVPPPDRNELLFHYGSLDITKGERFRFGHDFLNDTCLEFGLRYTLDKVLPKDITDSVHCFNSFFYEKLSKKERKKTSEDEWVGYDSVRRWTKKADIFNKKYVIVPVNESLHWYLAVIYNPRGILPAAVPVPPVSEQPVKHSNEASPTPSRPPSAASIADDSIDPINAIDQSDDEARRANGMAREDGDVRDVRSRVDAMDLDARPGETRDMDVDEEEEEEEPVELSPPPVEPAPQPIMSQTLALFHQQGEAPSRVSPVDDDKPATSPPPKVSGRQPSRPDYDILGSKDTWIFTFDSLGGRHVAVANNLKRWLQFEARDKLGVSEGLRDAEYLEGRVPTQPNFSDCGLYLIHFMERLLSHSHDVLEFIGKAPRTQGCVGSEEWTRELKTVWDATKVSGMRDHWVNVIDEEWSSYEHRRAKSASAPAAAGSPAPPEASQASVQIASQPPPPKAASDPPHLPSVPEDKGTEGTERRNSSEEEDQLDKALDVQPKTPPDSPVVSAPGRRRRVIPDTPQGAAASSEETPRAARAPTSPIQQAEPVVLSQDLTDGRFPVSDDSEEGSSHPASRKLSETSCVEQEQEDELKPSQSPSPPSSDPLEDPDILAPGKAPQQSSPHKQLEPSPAPIPPPVSPPGARDKDDPFASLGTRSALAQTYAYEPRAHGRSRGQPGIVRPPPSASSVAGPSTTPMATRSHAPPGSPKVLVPNSSPLESQRSESLPAKRDSDEMARVSPDEVVDSAASDADVSSSKRQRRGESTPPASEDDDLRSRGATPPRRPGSPPLTAAPVPQAPASPVRRRGRRGLRQQRESTPHPRGQIHDYFKRAGDPQGGDGDDHDEDDAGPVSARRQSSPRTYKKNRKRHASGPSNERSAKRRHDHATRVAGTAGAAGTAAGCTPETSIAVVDDSD